MAEPDQNELIASAKAGDARAFAALVEENYPFVFKTAYKWCGNREDAEDIAQDVAIKLARVTGALKGNAALSTWIYRTTLNAVRDFQRKNQRRADSLSAMAAEAGPVRAPDAGLEENELWQHVRNLAPKQRDAVLLVYAEGLSHSEAGKAMDCAEATVSWHIHRARKRLKGMLEGKTHG